MDEEQLRMLADEVRCPLCFEIFRIPRVLVCQHSFCTECLETLTQDMLPNDKELECPMCRNITVLDKGVYFLPVNLSLTNIISHLNSEEVRRAISPDLFTEGGETFLYDFPPSGPGPDYSFLVFEKNSQNHHHSFPRDINHLYCIKDICIHSHQAMDIFDTWIKNMWFSPSDLKSIPKPTVLLRYIPFYKISCRVKISYNKQIVHQSSSSRSSRTNFVFKKEEITQDHYICGSSSEYIRLLVDKLIPKEFPKNQELTTSNIEPDEAVPWFAACKNNNIHSLISSLAIKNIESNRDDFNTTYNVLKLNTNIEQISHQLCYFPFYISSYIYQGHMYSFAISGETGEIFGERPYGIGKLNLTKLKKWFF